MIHVKDKAFRRRRGLSLSRANATVTPKATIWRVNLMIVLVLVPLELTVNR